jgi:hypothetical protein
MRPAAAEEAMTLGADEMLALGAGALLLACVSLLGVLSDVLAWGLRLVAWALLITAIMAAP